MNVQSTETVYAEDVRIGDILMGCFEVESIWKADHFGTPAVQFNLKHKQSGGGRLILTFGTEIPIQSN